MPRPSTAKDTAVKEAEVYRIGAKAPPEYYDPSRRHPDMRKTHFLWSVASHRHFPSTPTFPFIRWQLTVTASKNRFNELKSGFSGGGRKPAFVWLSCQTLFSTWSCDKPSVVYDGGMLAI